MTRKLIAAATIVVASFSANASNLVLQDSETKLLTPGTYVYETIQLGRNATILLTGTTKLSAKTMLTDAGARIEYKKGSDYRNNAKMLELVVLNGEGMRGILSINGSAADGTDGKNGANGAHGDSEHTKTDTCYERVLGAKVPYPCLHHTDPTPGGAGQNGGHGVNGEEAMDLDVSLYKLHPSVHVILNSNGGNGGDGGNGGNGGNGGRGKRIERGANGGNGVTEEMAATGVMPATSMSCLYIKKAPQRKNSRSCKNS